MKALILNSGLGSRMGVLTSEHPKCMTEISPRETILSRQLRQIADAGIRDVVITTGLFRENRGDVRIALAASDGDELEELKGAWDEHGYWVVIYAEEGTYFVLQ